MRKWIFALVLVLISSLLAVAFFLPKELVIKKRFIVAANQNSVYRSLTDDNLIEKWFPGKKENGTSNTCFNGKCKYQFRKMVEVVKVDIRCENDELESYAMIFPVKTDSTAIEWIMSSKKAASIFQRISNYFSIRKADNEVGNLIKHFSHFVSNEDSVYGFKVIPTIVKDTLLITTEKEMDHFPSTNEYYSMIDGLHSYLTSSNVLETNYPMLNITPLPGNHFRTRVAIPINKTVSGNETISLKRMVPGKILTVEIRGGIKKVNDALTRMDEYIIDHRYDSPAIPFQSLITDRQQQKDTNSWITKIYYPVL